MKIRKAFATLTISVLSAITISDALSPQLVQAQPATKVAQGSPYTERTDCTNATLKGGYGYIDSGSRGTQATTFVPFNAVRTSNFDGNGNLEGQGYLSQGGVVLQYTTTGTYKVASDCSVTLTNTLTFPDGTTSIPGSQFGVIVDGGRKVLQIQTAPFGNDSGYYERIRS